MKMLTACITNSHSRDMTRTQFKSLLSKVSTRMLHRDLAKKLGISRELLRHWLYRNAPPALSVAALTPKLRKLWDKVEDEPKMKKR